MKLNEVECVHIATFKSRNFIIPYRIGQIQTNQTDLCLFSAHCPGNKQTFHPELMWML